MTDPLSALIARMKSFPITPNASPALRAAILAYLRARGRDLSLSAADIAPYDRRYIARPLYRDQTGWSLAAVVFAPGQATLAHDHEAWGCATTLRGVERVRRFANPAQLQLSLIEELDIPAGDGYHFDRDEIHQVIGADADGPTVALHLLVQGTEADRARQRFSEQMPPDGWRVPILPPTAIRPVLRRSA
jgi:predicted metal-dependent enzyme (double-stranded beta helix superfamily)